METYDQRHVAFIHKALVVVCEISHLVCRCLHRQELIIRRCRDLNKAGIFSHVECFKVRLKFDLSAPHLELLYEGIKVTYIVCFILDQEVL